VVHVPSIFAKALSQLPGAKLAPFPGYITPCSPALGVPDDPKRRWLCEIKGDGYRIQVHINKGKVTIFTRRGFDWTPEFASLVPMFKQLPVLTAVIDGELVVPDAKGVSDFNLFNDDLNAGRQDRFVYFAFDLPYLDGFDIRDLPLYERKRLLRKLLHSAPPRIQLSDFVGSDWNEVFRHACLTGLEGILVKDADSPYRSGKVKTWFKMKCQHSDTFPVIAFVEKLKAHPRRIASLYLGRWEGGRLLYAGKAEGGFEDKDLYRLRERLDPYIRSSSPLDIAIKKPKATWVEPLVEVEVGYDAITSDKVLRRPVYKGIRDDLARKPPKRVTRSVSRAKDALPVRTENILQLLPDAVAPSREALAAYWRQVAPHALKYLARRPLKLVRHVRGVTFYHRGRLPPTPPGVHELTIEKREGGKGTRLWIDDLRGLLGLLDLGVVEVHPWNATIDDIEHPDVMVFDLDPGSGIEWDFVTESALALRELLKAARLDAWPKVTGGKGIHVMVPIRSHGITHDEAHAYSRALTEKLVAKDRKRYTASASLSDRPGRIFLDHLRNGRGTTAIGTYSPRARPGFPIAAPVSWRDIEDGIRPDAFTIDYPFPRAPAVRTRASTRRTATDRQNATSKDREALPTSTDRLKQQRRRARRREV
jgi:bifunctional non-homologous end joining protein LigD